MLCCVCISPTPSLLAASPVPPLAAGSGIRSCVNGGWTSPSLVCRSVCNDVVAPIYTASCFRRYMDQPFSLRADPYLEQLFTVYPLGPVAERLRTFILDAAGESECDVVRHGPRWISRLQLASCSLPLALSVAQAVGSHLLLVTLCLQA